MVEYLYLVVYMGGLVVGSIGPLTATTEPECQALAARAQVSQPMHGAPIAHFACEWRVERPRVEAFIGSEYK
jgi:hypothetical protein